MGVTLLLITFFAFGGHHSSNSDQQVATSSQTPGTALDQDGAQATPFIPEPAITSAPRNVPVVSQPIESSPPVVPIVTQQGPPESGPPQTAAQAPVQPPTPVPDAKLNLEPPQQQRAQQPQTANTQGESGQQTAYVPVYDQNHKLIGVRPVLIGGDSNQRPTLPSSPNEGAANTQVASAPGGGAPQETSAQFLTTQRTPSPAQNQRKFAETEASRAVGYVPPSSQDQLTAGTVINARLLTKIQTGLPGSVVGQVSEPVYDSTTHSKVVIPAGTKVFGTYDNEIYQNEERVLMSFRRLIMPDGEEFEIGGQAGSGSDGTAGFGGDVDKHRGAIYGAALLLTVLGGAEAALSPQQGSVLSGPNIGSSITTTAGSELDNVGNQIIGQSINRPPTIIIRAPYSFQIIVQRDLPLDQYRVDR
jgi:type IV secretion system protein VirB10